MARLKDLAVRTTDQLQMNPRDIEIDPGYNHRGFEPDTDEDDKMLLESIRANGVRTPITIRQDGERLLVVAGHRRLSAVKILIDEGIEIASIPCVPEARGTNEADRDADLIISNTHKKVSPLQQSEPLKRLLGHGWSEKDISVRTGLRVDQIRAILDLAGAGHEITDMVKSGEISAGVAMKVVKKSGSKAKDVLAKASSIAKKSGQKRVTAKAIESARTNDGTEIGLNARGKRQIPKKELTSTLRSILETDDIGTAHHLARMCLGIKKTSLEAAENAEILADFKVRELPGHNTPVENGAEMKSAATEW